MTLTAKWTPKTSPKDAVTITAPSVDENGKVTPPTVTVDEGANIGTVEIIYVSEDGTESTEIPTDPGKYEVKIKVDESDDYASATLTDEAWNFEIPKKETQNPGETEPGETNPGETKPDDSKKDDGKTDPKPDDGKKDDGKTDPKPDDGKTEEPKKDEPTEPETPAAFEPNPASVATGIGVVVVGTAVVGYAGYRMAREMFATAILPAGAAMPTNKAELALLLWKEAEQPQPETEAAFADIADTDTLSAAQWAVANGLMSAEADGTFAPEKSVNLVEVYKAVKAENTWQKANK